MTTSEQAKAMARRLREAMTAKGRDTSHSEALELVAQQLGHRDWNTANALFGRIETETPQFTHSVPVLRSLDERKCRAFYCDFLGFEVEFEHRFEQHLPLYLGLKRGPVELHLTEHPGDATTGSAVFVWMTGIAAYRAEISARRILQSVPEIVAQPWGNEVSIADPFGNRLRFCQRPG